MNYSDFAKGLELFAFYLHDQLSRANPEHNLIYSPISIRTCAGMLRLGATEKSATARELDEGLRFGDSTVQRIAESFDTVLSAYAECRILKIANRLYVKMGESISGEFGSIIERKFHSKAIEIDFGSPTATSIINSWVESQTNNLITNIITPDDVSSDTRLILVNAIHFKGEWSIRFDKAKTEESDFFLKSVNSVKVRMMHGTNKFSFAELPNLEATVLKMDYKACNLAMIFILPNEQSSLENLELKLPGTTLETIISAMTFKLVDVKIPKFKAELAQELSSSFKMMGMNRIFTDQAEFSGIVASHAPLYVSKILHKAFIEVNEMGTEAAAATGVVLNTRSLPIPQEPPMVFHANRPFFYAICDSTHGFLFVGHL
ncbi:hypothetical protein KR009_004421, partial [Drosophila setifemur]